MDITTYLIKNKLFTKNEETQKQMWEKLELDFYYILLSTNILLFIEKSMRKLLLLSHFCTMKLILVSK